MKNFKYLLCLFACTSCTFSVIINQTHGTANDLVDEEQGASADLDATIPAM
jgi:hypothetical protein